MLTGGARQVNGFIITERYSMEKAVRDAAKVAYLTKLIRNGIDIVTHYNPEMNETLIAEIIQDQTLNKMNRIKKLSLEAFFYWRQIEEMCK